MKKQTFAAAVLMTALISACASPAASEGTQAAGETAAAADAAQSGNETQDAGETTGDSEAAEGETTGTAKETGGASEGLKEELTGKGKGFGGTITAHVTTVDGVITEVVLEGPDETPGIGGAALEELAGQFVEVKGAEIDGVSGATVTSQGHPVLAGHASLGRQRCFGRLGQYD